MTPAEVLLAAADALVTHEWCQGSCFVDAEGNRQNLNFLKQPAAEPIAACAVGAICIVAGDDIESRNAAIALLERHLAGGNSDVRPCVSKWNDDRRRTKDDVIQAMRRAARSR